MICFSRNKEQSQFGKGFIIHKNYKHCVMDFHSEGDKLCSLRVKGKFSSTTIIHIYALTEEKDGSHTHFERIHGVCVCVCVSIYIYM
jgi:hypothetical protein